MENMDRADMQLMYKKALSLDMKTILFQVQQHKQLLISRDVLTSPGAINRGLKFVQPFLQRWFLDNFNVETDPVIIMKREHLYHK